MQITERFGKPATWRDLVEGIYFVLRERAQSEAGLLTETPKGSAPVWCEYHDSIGDPIPNKDWGAANRLWRATVCATASLDAAGFDAWLTGVDG